MQYKRSDRLASQIKTEIAQILLKETNDPALSFVTITKVNVSGDLKYVKISYSVLGDNSRKEKAGEALQRANKFIRKELAGKIKIRFMPELRFTYDGTVEYANRIENLLAKIHREESKGSE